MNSLLKYINNKGVGPGIDNTQEVQIQNIQSTGVPGIASIAQLQNDVKDIMFNDGAAWRTLPTITPFPRNRQGIIDAIESLRNVAKNGVVLYQDAVYDISDYSAGPIILYKGISHIGVKPTFEFTGSVPDSQFNILSGTIFDGGSTSPGFELNNVDLASATTAEVQQGASLPRLASAFASNGTGSFNLHNLGFRNCTRSIDTGAVNNIGLLYCDIKWIVSENSVQDWAFKFHNFQHCTFEHVYAKTNRISGSGIEFASSVGATLLPGNSTISEVYNFSTGAGTRGIRFAAMGGVGCQLNELKVNRIQSNRYGLSSTKSISMTTVSGSSAISVSAADAQWLKPEMTVVFNVSAPQWLAMNTTYFISSVDTTLNTITLADNPLTTGAIALNQSGTFVAQTGGFPSFSIVSNGNSLVTASAFDSVDIECTGSTSPLVLRRIRNTSIEIMEQFSGALGTSTTIRDCGSTALRYKNLSGITLGVDASSSVFPVQISAGNRYITASKTVSGAEHQCTLINSTATAITLTIPTGMPRFFTFRVIQGSTGQITFAAGAGVTITNAVGLKTSGASSVVELVELSANNYLLIGSTAA